MSNGSVTAGTASGKGFKLDPMWIIAICAVLLVLGFFGPALIAKMNAASTAAKGATAKTGENVKESAAKTFSGGSEADAKAHLTKVLDEHKNIGETYTLEGISNSDALSKLNTSDPMGASMAQLLNDNTKTVWFYIQHVTMASGTVRDYPEPVWQDNSNPGVYHTTHTN